MAEIENLDPEDVMNSTTDQVKHIVGKILNIEKEYQHFKNIPKSKEKGIIDKLVNIFHEEIN